MLQGSYQGRDDSGAAIRTGFNVLEECLEAIERPAELAQIIAERFFRCSGASAVYVIRSGDQSAKVPPLLALVPERQVSSSMVYGFEALSGALCSERRVIQLFRRGEAPGGEIVALLGGDTLLVVPLRSGEKLVGLLVLLDPPADVVSGELHFVFSWLLPSIARCLGLALRREAASLLKEADVDRLAAHERRWRLVSEHQGEIIVRVDRDGRIQGISPSCRRVFGKGESELRGHRLLPLVHPDDRPNLRRALQLGFERAQTGVERTRVLTVEGWSWTDWTMHVDSEGEGGPGTLVLVGREVGEQKRLEDQLRQSQKMEAIGLLAGGVAHDFNNLLTAINGYGALVLETLDVADPRRADLEQVLRAADRATALTRQLLAFSRRQALEPVVIDLNGVISDLAKMLQRLIGEHIKLRAELEPGLHRIEADAGQVEQVIINLAVNARDAMSEGGTLEVTTSNVELLQAEARSFDVAPGRYILLRMSDTGEGISPENIDRIFEPFFTTKDADKGTGLGLSTVYGILRQNHGGIRVSSEVGRGTIISVVLPEAAIAHQISQSTTRWLEELAGHETILVVEDEEAVRSLACRALKKLGYTVLEATTADGAFTLVKDLSEPIHLLLSDVVLPGMTGPEMAKRLELFFPDMRILFMSGYPGEAVVRHGLAKGVSFLRKPFDLQELGQKVREALTMPFDERLP